ncbi:hypothetical protein K7X08_018992 [Anisodus acutangulus]|uniref:Uncharacterized protein n=1 Tax=Anisodus acutangulus TaxID=402998 RepID=A0A9Q1M0C2_9SOLA|nr:hypothetical protein K7X08_018992 [Anisodus acutangulus]
MWDYRRNNDLLQGIGRTASDICVLDTDGKGNVILLLIDFFCLLCNNLKGSLRVMVSITGTQLCKVSIFTSLKINFVSCSLSLCGPQLKRRTKVNALTASVDR